MSLNRNVFLDNLVKDSVKLNTLFLNHSGSPAKLHSDMPSVDLLTDKAGVRGFIEYCRLHPLVNEVILTPRFMRMKVQVSFRDGSQLNFKLIRKMIKKSLDCLPVKDIMKEATVNDYGMMIPSTHHHFEYILLKYQFAESAFPDKFQKYFSSLDSANRVSIFRYIQPKYSLVFNILEDLYTHKGAVLLKIMIGLRHRKENMLFKMAFRLMLLGMWNMKHLFSRKTILLPAKDTTGPSSGEATDQKSKQRAVK